MEIHLETLRAVVLSPITSAVVAISGLVLYLIQPDSDAGEIMAAVWLSLGTGGSIVHLLCFIWIQVVTWRKEAAERNRIAEASKDRATLIAQLPQQELRCLKRFFTQLWPSSPTFLLDQHNPEIIALTSKGFLHKQDVADSTSLDALYTLRPWAYEQPFRQHLTDRIENEKHRPAEHEMPDGLSSCGAPRAPRGHVKCDARSPVAPALPDLHSHHMTLDLPPTLEDHLRRLAQRQGRDVKAVVEDAVVRYLASTSITDLTAGELGDLQMRLASEETAVEPWRDDPGAHGETR